MSPPSSPVPTGKDMLRPPSGRREQIAKHFRRFGVIRGIEGLRRKLDRKLRVLAYHRVRDITDDFSFDPELISASPTQFREQIRYVRDRYTPVRCEDVVESVESGTPLPHDAVLITFDDGYDDNYDVAFPILKSLGVPATFFVSTGHIDGGHPYAYDWLAHMVRETKAPNVALPDYGFNLHLPEGRDDRLLALMNFLSWYKRRSDGEQTAIMKQLEEAWNMPRTSSHPDCRPMTWSQLREMHAAGMSIGAHGVHHRMLAKLEPHDLHAEVNACKARLEHELDSPALAISYPVGNEVAYDARVIDAVKQAGFKIAFTYLNGYEVLPLESPYELRRQSVERSVEISWFSGILALPELFSYPDPRRGAPR